MAFNSMNFLLFMPLVVLIYFALPLKIRYIWLLLASYFFYTFQVVGYMIDVYRQEVKAEKNFLRYALFISFFPQIGSGPIARAKNLLKQMQIPTRFDLQNVRYGLLTMAYCIFRSIGNLIPLETG